MWRFVCIEFCLDLTGTVLGDEMLNLSLNLRYIVSMHARSEEDRQVGGCSGSARDRCNKVVIATIVRRFSASR